MNYKFYGYLFKIGYFLFLALATCGFLAIFGGVGRIDYMHETGELVTSWHMVKAFAISATGIIVACLAGRIAFGADYIAKLCFKKHRRQIRSKQIRQFQLFRLRKVS